MKDTLSRFFDFWVHAANKSGPGEIAHAETLAAPPYWYDTATQQKRIQRPAEIMSGSGSEFRTKYTALTSTDILSV
jgi:hypothetical protein